MNLDRNDNAEGKGKYALALLRNVDAGSEAHGLLLKLADMGVIDWGNRGSDSEFFVIRLKDKFAAPALRAYADAAEESDQIYSLQVRGMAERAASHPAQKMPD